MNMMPSRHGRRALVTRPRAEAVALTEALDRRGIEAIIEPLLDILYRDEPAPDLTGVQAVLCTSANGVRALARRSGERDIALFAVGEATAERDRRLDQRGSRSRSRRACVRRADYCRAPRPGEPSRSARPHARGAGHAMSEAAPEPPPDNAPQNPPPRPAPILSGWRGAVAIGFATALIVFGLL